MNDIREACEAAFKNHSKKNDVVNFNSDFDGNSLKLYEWYLDGTYVSKIKYRKLVKENKNGKVREINSPDLTTRIYQHLVLVKLGPLYYEKDNMNGLNCKPGFGITASSKSRSLIKNLAKRIAPFSLRYADDNFLAFYTKEDANTAKWRIKNYWWYELKIRSKRHTCIITDMDRPLDFCGYVFHRNNKGVSEHNKGYVTIRKRVAKDAKKCITNESWSSYFGLLKHCDSYSLMSKIENIMKLRDLTSTIRIDKKMDADSIDVKNLEGIVFDIVNYEIRSNNKNEPNWIKCLIGIPETNKEGIPTGRKLAREFHGNYQGIVNFISKCELTYGKDAILPITDVEIENRCGYVFKGSTNRLEYID